MNKIHDELKFSENKDILKIITDEKLLFSSQIIKINAKGYEQQRNLLITSKALYNLKKKELKRRIDISKLTGITISRKSDQFVIHGDEEYDYHYISVKKNIIIGYIYIVYVNLNNMSLRLSIVNEENLLKYVTNKHDKKYSNKSKMDTQNLVDIIDYLNDNGVFADEENDEINYKNCLPEKESLYKFINLNNNNINQKICLSDFNVLDIINSDFYNKTLLMEYEGKKFIMKSITIENDEIDLFNYGKIPFIIEIEYCFKSPERVFFLNYYNNEKTLQEILKSNVVIEEEKIKFFIINIGFALENLHKNNIIYATLKPENILLGEDGYFNITDVLIAKYEQKKKIFINKIEYLSPEILEEKEYDKNSDWWSLGIIIYELLFGIPPFFEENKEQLIKRIKMNNLKYPKKSQISDSAKELLIKLLNEDKTKRIQNFEELKNDPYLTNIDINSIIEKKFISPFKE
jgi:serum/glucocorticoid-regulated kinase 2